MNLEIDKQLAHVILQTLQSCLSPDKELIKKAQQQLTVIQVKSGNVSFFIQCVIKNYY